MTFTECIQALKKRSLLNDLVQFVHQFCIIGVMNNTVYVSCYMSFSYPNMNT